MAVVIQGAIIFEEKGNMMKYCKKCESCGFVESNIKTNVQQPGPRSKLITSFRCPKCKNNQKVEIQG